MEKKSLQVTHLSKSNSPQEIDNQTFLSKMNTLCFEQILNKSSSFILINDSIRLSGMSILVDIGKRALKNNKSLVVLLTETSPKVWKKQFESTKDIHIIDCYTDPYGWDNVNKANDDPNVQLINNITDIENSILLPLIKQVNDTPCCTILVDSLASLFMVSQFKTYQLVKTLESLTTGWLSYFFFFIHLY